MCVWSRKRRFSFSSTSTQFFSSLMKKKTNILSVSLRHFRSDRLLFRFIILFFARLQLLQVLLKSPCRVSSVCSRLVLQEVLDADLSNEAFPFSSHKVVRAAGHQVGLKNETGWSVCVCGVKTLKICNTTENKCSVWCGLTAFRMLKKIKTFLNHNYKT